MKEPSPRRLTIRAVGLLVIALVTSLPLKASTEKVLHTFSYGKDGVNPEAPLVRDADGNLYGTTASGGPYNFGVVLEVAPKHGGGWTETVVHAFKGGSDGAVPTAGLLLDSTGTLYGTTSNGGGTPCNVFGCGVVFALSPKTGGGWKEQVLYRFTGTTDGAIPRSSLIMDSAGTLYGSTDQGGSYGYGTVFSLTRQGSQWNEKVLYAFKGSADGNGPLNLIFDTAGNLYGTTRGGGYSYGTVFELTPTSSGWTESVLYRFMDSDGAYPYGGLVSDAAGNLYGTTWMGGDYEDGVLYELSSSGGTWSESVLHSFNYSQDGANPFGTLLIDASGNLYGTTSAGGGTGGGHCGHLHPYCGTVFEFSSVSGLTVLYRFMGTKDGGDPTAGLVRDEAGNLYGTTQAGGLLNINSPGENSAGTVYQLVAGNSWTETVLHAFSRESEGAQPEAGLALDPSGNLYGTTYYGGTRFVGTAFRLSPNHNGTWSESVLRSLSGGKGVGFPTAGLLLDTTGALYGTTIGDGLYNRGTVYKIAPRVNGGWSQQVLYSFCPTGACQDGSFPRARLISDDAGNLYGTTMLGGAYGIGTVFRLAPGSGGSWAESVLYSFTGQTDGGSPTGGVILDSKGNLYGTTAYGGNSSSGGVVFELSPSGHGQWTDTVLYSFGLGMDGGYPYAGLTFDGDGSLYGTTGSGGTNNLGVVFELRPSVEGQWSETVLHSFAGGTDGSSPFYGVMFSESGSLYGATGSGGGTGCNGTGCGTVFELRPSGGNWTESVLHRFKGGKDGEFPSGELISDDIGNLYGVTQAGGTYGAGVVYEIVP